MRGRFLLVLLLLCSYSVGHADSGSGQAVYVDLCVAEQDVNRIREKVHEPVMAALMAVPGTGDISGAATHGMAQFQVRFRQGASRNDKASVEEALKQVELAPEVTLLSTRVELGQARDDGLFVGRPACAEHRRRGR